MTVATIAISSVLLVALALCFSLKVSKSGAETHYRKALEAIRKDALERSDVEPYARIVYDQATAALMPKDD